MLTRCDSTQVVYILEWICDDAFIRSYVWCIRIQVYMLKHIISDIFICLVFIINFVSSFPARVFGYVCEVMMTNTTHHRSFFFMHDTGIGRQFGESPTKKPFHSIVL